MATRVNCQSAGTHPEGHPCAYFDQTFLACAYTPKEGEPLCIYQVDPGFGEEDLERREQVGAPEDVALRARIVREGADRVRELWGQEIYDTIGQAMCLVARYQPGQPDYNPGNFLNLTTLSDDIVKMHAHGTFIATQVGNARADFKALEAWRSRLHAEKYMAVKESYAAGLRRGKITDKAIDYHCRVNGEYIEAVENTLRAERQVLVLEGFYEALIELVNSLKKKIETLLAELKYGTRSAG